MGDFPPHWVPYMEEPYYQNIAFYPSLQQPVVGLRRGSSLPPGMLVGFHRPVVGGSHMFPLPAYRQGIWTPVVRPQTLMRTRDSVFLRQQTRDVEHKTRAQSVTHKGNARNAMHGIREKYGGTGVFLPVSRPTDAPATKCRQGEKAKQKKKAKEIEVKKEAESDFQLPPDISLPPE